MNHHDERVSGGCGHANGFGQKRFHLKPVVVAGEGEGFHFGDGLITQKFLVEIGELARGLGARFQIKLIGVTRRGERISNRAVTAG